MGLTAAQEAAVNANNRELLVSAAAGSGKTRVLIERIFTLIHNEGLSVDRLLIVTFTRAAAAEMRERLQDRLSQEAAADRRMRRQTELLENAQISTLHSFCQKLVREYFQAADIDPQASLGDETACANLRNQAKSEALDHLYERAGAGDSPSAALTAKFEEKQIDKMLDDLYPFLMSLPEPFEWLEGCANKRYSSVDLTQGEMQRTLLADCRLLLEGALSLAQANAAIGEEPLCPQPYRDLMRADVLSVEALAQASREGLTPVTAAAAAFLLDRLPTLRKLDDEQSAIRDRYKEGREGVKKIVKSVSSHLPEQPETAIERLNAMQPALSGLAALAKEMDECYAQRKRDRNLLDYNDLERMALKILKDKGIREAVSARFDGVFVDEYQDISAVQEAILNALKRDVSRETTGVTQRYFYVGDVKQSIYRFRQADPTLFMEKAKAFSQGEQAPQRRISLNANFRSRETVLRAVNRVFGRVMRGDVTEIEYDEQARLYPGVPSGNDPPTTLHLFTQPVKAAQRVQAQAYAVAQEIERRVGRPVTDREGNPAGTLRYRDIAVLGPKMKGVSDVLEKTLSERGIPVYCEDGGSGMETEEIGQALNFLRLLNNFADDLALLAWLRGPAFGMSDRELAAVRLGSFSTSYLDAVRKAAAGEGALAGRCSQALAELEHERFLLTETPLNEYLWGWLNRSGLYAFYGCQPGGKLRQANLRMLCEKAGDHVKRRGGDLQDFLSSVEAQTGARDASSPTVLSPWEDVVRVMSIHKSKGLEFPVVFVVGLEESFIRKSASSLAMHSRLGVALPYVNENMRTTSDTLLKAAMDLRAQAEERAERTRLLYVAMTRARDELVLLGSSGASLPDDCKTRAESAGSAYEVFGAGSMLDWVCQCLNRNDDYIVSDAPDVSDILLRTTQRTDEFSTQNTNFPQKQPGWTVVFHNDPSDTTRAQCGTQACAEPDALNARRERLAVLAREARLAAMRLSVTAEVGDPVAPKMTLTHQPFKVGATALAYADRQAEQIDTPRPDEAGETTAETADLKRLPLAMARVKRMDDLPALPAFLAPPAEQTGLRRGVATHKALSLLPYARLRDVIDEPEPLRARIVAELNELCARRRLMQQERLLVEAEPIAAFLESPWGRRALTSSEVRREWSFNLLLPERDGLIVQGIVDLCYLFNGQWVLVDYKTDRVADTGELWQLYGEQIALYRRALTQATGVPVREAVLYSLSLRAGEAR